MIEIRRTWRFCASHRLHRDDWDDARNEQVYGSSARAPGHGHNFRLSLLLQGEPDPETGRLVDLRGLDATVERQVVDAYDHKNLNADVATLEGVVPTLENLLRDVAKRLQTAPFWPLIAEIRLEIDEFLQGSLQLRSRRGPLS